MTPPTATVSISLERMIEATASALRNVTLMAEASRQVLRIGFGPELTDTLMPVLNRMAQREPLRYDLPLMGAIVLSHARRWHEAMAQAERAVELQPAVALPWNVLLPLWREVAAYDRVRVSVVIPATGIDALDVAVASVLRQSHPNIELLVIIDGPEFAERTRKILGRHACPPWVIVSELPRNSGAQGFNGHRIYGAAASLADGHFLAWLDEDNWFEPTHLARMVRVAVDRACPWVYSLRTLRHHDGSVFDTDDCKSLGQWPDWEGGPPFVDTNCYLVRRDVAIEMAPTWVWRSDNMSHADRRLSQRLSATYPIHAGTGEYSVNYRIRIDVAAPVMAYFQRGNAVMRARYGPRLPWRAHSDRNHGF